MAPIQRTNALQGFFTFDEDDWAQQVCTCFHGTIPGQYDANTVLLCSEAPWWCPSRTVGGERVRIVNPPLSNRGVSSREFDPDSTNLCDDNSKSE